jgi:hypothetical protein
MPRLFALIDFVCGLSATSLKFQSERRNMLSSFEGWSATIRLILEGAAFDIDPTTQSFTWRDGKAMEQRQSRYQYENERNVRPKVLRYFNAARKAPAKRKPPVAEVSICLPQLIELLDGPASDQTNVQAYLLLLDEQAERIHGHMRKAAGVRKAVAADATQRLQAAGRAAAEEAFSFLSPSERKDVDEAWWNLGQQAIQEQDDDLLEIAERAFRARYGALLKER